jgi:NADH:ubiquinone oxidoreductase subunit F (NADH-binding)
MTRNGSETLAHTSRYGILSHPTDLAGHVRSLGALPIPRVVDLAWQRSLVASLEISGLTGRGGAAFPSGVKLAAALTDRREGIVVANGMEGEPASDKDKVLLTRSPHLVLDGAQLLAAASGATQVLVAVPEGRDAVAAAVFQAIGERAASGHIHVREEIVRPPDRFVAGEESALARWIDDKNSLPSLRLDKSVRLRIGARPVLVHNAETLAHVALIARVGPQAFRSRGMPEEPGTSLVTITGAVTHPGVVEIDRGTPIEDIVALAAPVTKVQALLIGGYGGSWIGPEHFGTPYASIPLRTIGASAGVGIVAVLGAPACGLAEAGRVARYASLQSSGQCGPCVFGLPAIADDLSRLARGRPDPGLLARLEHRLAQVDGRGACRHPDGTVGMVRSALRVFAADVTAHLDGNACGHHTRPTQLRFPHPVEA